MPRKPNIVREPIQVYLDGRDRALLDSLAEKEGLSRAEILRMALRRLGAGVAEGKGSGLSALTGVLSETGAPEDLAARHDDYRYAAPPKRKKGSR